MTEATEVTEKYESNDFDEDRHWLNQHRNVKIKHRCSGIQDELVSIIKLKLSITCRLMIFITYLEIEDQFLNHLSNASPRFFSCFDSSNFRDHS